MTLLQMIASFDRSSRWFGKIRQNHQNRPSSARTVSSMDPVAQLPNLVEPRMVDSKTG